MLICSLLILRTVQLHISVKGDAVSKGLSRGLMSRNGINKRSELLTLASPLIAPLAQHSGRANRERSSANVTCNLTN